MTTQTIPIIPSNTTITSENKCSFCTGSICCTYITQQIETPKTKLDFTNLLWQVSHKNVSIYKDEGLWSLLIDGDCAHLLPGGGCGIYDSRPHACREYSNDYCEFDAPSEESFDLYFPNYESLLKNCKKKFKNWDSKKTDKNPEKKLKKKKGKKIK